MSNRLQAIASALRRWRLLPIFLITLPLLLPPLILLTAFVQYYKLTEVSDWTQLTLPQAVRAQRRQCLDALTRDFHPELNPGLPVINLHVGQNELDSLNSSLPMSGFVEKPGVVETGAGFQKVRVRYRGDSNYHWIYPKKSWSIQTRRNEPLLFGRRLALINPKDSEVITQYVGRRVGEKFGLLTTPVRMAALNVNKRYNGVYVCTQPPDESFLCYRGEMPGEIWVGDPSHQKGMPGEFFSNPYIWRQVSAYKGTAAWEVHPLERLVREINDRSYWLRERRLMDEEYMARYCAFVSFAGTNHYDATHNLKYYLNPLTGQFQMLEWDTCGFTMHNPAPDTMGVDIGSPHLLTEMQLNPVFNYQKNKFLYDLLRKPGFVEEVQRDVAAIVETIRPYVERDTLDTYGENKGRSFREAPFMKQIENLNAIIGGRAEWLKRQLGICRVEYAWRDGALKLDVTGYAPAGPIRVTMGGSVPRALEIAQDTNLDGRYQEGIDRPARWRTVGENAFEIEEMVYPGRYVRENAPPNPMEPGPLSYVYLLRGADGLEVASVEGVNAITGGPAEVKRGDGWAVAESDSLHPWQHETLRVMSRRAWGDKDARSWPEKKKNVSPPMVLQDPEIHLTENWVIAEDENFVIPGGVTVLLDPGISVLSYGRLACAGIAEKPVVFRRAKEDAPWGVVALQGTGASGSAFMNTRFEGGGDAKLNDVYYSGMVSAHYADDARFTSCTFAGNTASRDLLRVAKSGADVTSCTFRNAFEDAVALEFSSGTLRQCRVENTKRNAVEIRDSSVVLDNNRIERAGGAGILCAGNRSAPVLFECQTKDVATGIAVEDGAEPLVVSCSIKAEETGILQRSSDWRYADGGHARVNISGIESNGVALSEDSSSDLGVRMSWMVGTGKNAATPASPTMKSLYYDADAMAEISTLLSFFPTRKDAPISSDAMYLRIGLDVGKGSYGYPVPDDSLRSQRPRLPDFVFSDRFQEDFTSDLGQWVPNGNVVRARKDRRVLELRGFPGKRAVISRRVDAPDWDGRGVLVVEARAPRAGKEPERETKMAAVFVRGAGPGGGRRGADKVKGGGRVSEGVAASAPREVRHEMRLGGAMREWLFESPGGPLERIEIELPDSWERVQLRKVELIRKSGEK
jgi:hypothetical protein